MFGLGIGELIFFGMIAVLLFGKKLPDVARSFGQQYNDLRRGLQEIQKEMTRASSSVTQPLRDASYSINRYEADDYEAPTTPRFELPAPTSDSEPSPATCDVESPIATESEKNGDR